MSKRSYTVYEYEKNKHLLHEAGRAKSASLFHETAVDPIRTPPLFKLSDWHKVYIDIADPTEYETSMVLIGNWEFWNKLKESVSVGPYFKSWKDELEVKLRSQGIVSLLEQAAKGNATAARYLADAEFFGGKKGKKSRAEKEAETVLRNSVGEKVKHDMERLGLKVVDGGNK